MFCVHQEQKRKIIGLLLLVNNCMHGMEFCSWFDSIL